MSSAAAVECGGVGVEQGGIEDCFQCKNIFHL